MKALEPPTRQQQVNLMELDLMTCVWQKGVLAYMSVGRSAAF